MNELLLNSTAQMNSTDMMLSDRSQIWKNTAMLCNAFVCKVQRQEKSTYGVRNQEGGYLWGDLGAF
jgi:hypothetical protein